MTTQVQLDEMIANAKAALYAINPVYAPDYVPENKKPLRNSAVNFNQVDWTGEESVNNFSDCCPMCNGVMPFSFGVGRPASYCSNACKMKAYRQRQKALRIEDNVLPFFSPVGFCSLEVELLRFEDDSGIHLNDDVEFQYEAKKRQRLPTATIDEAIKSFIVFSDNVTNNVTNDCGLCNTHNDGGLPHYLTINRRSFLQR